MASRALRGARGPGGGARLPAAGGPGLRARRRQTALRPCVVVAGLTKAPSSARPERKAHESPTRHPRRHPRRHQPSPAGRAGHAPRPCSSQPQLPLWGPWALAPAAPTARPASAASARAPPCTGAARGAPGARRGPPGDPCASCQLSERYGPVFTVHLGCQKTVVLAGYEAVREALVGTGQELADRPPIAIFQLIQGGGGRCVVGSRGPTRWDGPSAGHGSPWSPGGVGT